MSVESVNGIAVDTVEIEEEDNYIYNRASERIESIPNMAKELGIKTPATLANQVEKALAAGEMKAQRKQGKTVYFRVVDLKAAHAKYGRKPSEGMVTKADHDYVLQRNQELSAENAALILRVRELEEMLAAELSKLSQELDTEGTTV